MRTALFFVLAFGVASAVPAQILNIPVSQCVWRVGDDPAWAAGNLDESNWRPLTDGKLQPDDLRLWFRCHADLSSLRGVAHPAIQIFVPAAYQLFLNGEPIGGTGDLRSGSFSTDIGHTFLLSQRVPQDAAITLRVSYRYVVMSASNLLPSLTVQAGDERALSDRRAATVLADASRILRTTILYGVIGVFGFVLLGLYLNDRSRLELLLLSFECIATSGIYLNLAGANALLDYPARMYCLIFSLSTVVSQVVYPWFFFRLLQRRVPLLLWAAIALASFDHALWAPIALLPLAPSRLLGAVYANWAAQVGFSARVVVAFAPFIAFWPYSRISRRILPLAIPCLVWGTQQVLYFLVRLSVWQVFGLPNFAPRWNLTLAELEPVISFCVVAVLIGLLFREQRKVAEESAEMTGQLQAARRVQQYLIPAQLPATPGFAIESEYLPTREVGGDFFQVIPQADNSLLVVVGDVAGKGVEAGMLAALIVGAIRTAAAFTPDPERILALLNERLFQLDVGDRLMLMSDGIAEAQDAHGALFGFDRIGQMLRDGRAAAELATAAQSFGQADDITVLTLSYAAAEVVHA
jgi:hypothetical protein